MQLAPVENLPVELLEMVLEIIEDDTLKACSLVCHFWRKVALRYLFMFIVNRSARSFEDLLHFLRDHPHVAEHINVLTLTGPKCDADANYIFPQCDNPTILGIVQCLPNDADLELKRVQIIDSAIQEEVAFSTDKLKLWQLYLKQCEWKTAGPSAAMVALVSPLEAEFLQILEPRFTVLSSVPPSSKRGHDALLHPRSPHVRSMCWNGITTDCPLPLSSFRGYLAPTCLKALHLTFHDWAHLVEIGQVLHHVSGSLTSMTFTFANALDDYRLREHERESHLVRSHIHISLSMLTRHVTIATTEEWEALHLSSLSNLRFICFELKDPLITHWGGPTGGNPSWVDEIGIAAFLGQFPKAIPLQHVGVFIRVTFREQRIGWRRSYIHYRTKIEDALLQFENLDGIGIEVRGYRPFIEFVEKGWMRAASIAFPKFASMGKLYVWEPEPNVHCW